MQVHFLLSGEKRPLPKSLLGQTICTQLQAVAVNNESGNNRSRLTTFIIRHYMSHILASSNCENSGNRSNRRKELLLVVLVDYYLLQITVASTLWFFTIGSGLCAPRKNHRAPNSPAFDTRRREASGVNAQIATVLTGDSDDH